MVQWVATSTVVTVHTPAGRRKASYPAHPGITAVARVGRGLVLGYREGNLEYLAMPGASGKVPRLIPESSAASPVERLIPGPGGTVVAGHADGSVGLWSLASGRRLRRARLHGPVSHLLLRLHHLYVATELGDHTTWDLGVLEMDYCALMRKVWRDIPVAWSGGRPTLSGPPAKHRCKLRLIESPSAGQARRATHLPRLGPAPQRSFLPAKNISN